MRVMSDRAGPLGSAEFEQYLMWRRILDDPLVELDMSLSGLVEEDVSAQAGPLSAALAAMEALEGGALANADEGRMVGHYWLRAPARAPNEEIADEIAATIERIENFARSIHAGSIAPPEGGVFRKVVVIGVGGSALGPMLVADAMAQSSDPMIVQVMDNTDPDGIDRLLAGVAPLQDCLFIITSKSGGTPETRNGMLEVESACREQGLDFASRAIAVTVPTSALGSKAREEDWLAVFPMWDWVGGRTSVFSAVGLLPAALQGVDIRGFLGGAAAMDEWTRVSECQENPGALLALMWWKEGQGRGERDLVVLPYKDRLILLSRYLQQLVMESLGKRLDRQGNVVGQGLTVYGNKGSTDQHALVQQLRDGRHSFFAHFVRVLEDRSGPSTEVVPTATSGDFLDGFLQGTRRALFEEGRHCVTITVDRVDARSLGALIALFERSVGIYAELIDVNAYHQPGVEAGKEAAASVLELQERLLGALSVEGKTCVELAVELGADPCDVWPILQHLALNRPEVRCPGPLEPGTALFALRGGD
jgi:glucose-6-phosphate isomerase